MSASPEPTDYRALLKDAYFQLEELQAQVEVLEQARNEPIAIIGAGCRVPGGANDLEGLRRLLHAGVDAVDEVPAERWDIDGYYDSDPAAVGKMVTRHGAFLRDVDQFDAEFFGIAPREAVSMDPQQRLLLEVSWEALEHAGQPADRLSGTRTGVFVGISTTDYARLHVGPDVLERIDAYTGSGSAFSVAAGRLSYALGLQGPSLALDTACSSSLVAVHLACQSLRNGEADLALAGGVNLILTPEATVYFSRAGMMAPDGRCRAFDAEADGYVRGEGCGVVVLKRLGDAQRDGDRVLAIIRGSAVNHDGRSNGLTAPNGPAQEAVIRAALEQGHVPADQVGYVEAHGTGTPLGDPIELRALANVLGASRHLAPPVNVPGATRHLAPPVNVPGATRHLAPPLLVGTVKTNVGHLEAAAGVVGLLKAVLAVRTGEIPANLHFQQPTPHFDWASHTLEVPTQPRPWPPSYARRIAGVSSFGFSGTNAHVVIEQPPDSPQLAHAAAPPEVSEAPAPQLLVLSARTEPALRAAAEHLSAHLLADHTPDRPVDLAPVSAALARGRAQLEERLAVVADSAPEAATALHHFSPAAGAGRGVLIQRGRAASGLAQGVALLCSGQGSVYPRMGLQLAARFPLVRATLEEADLLVRQHADWSLLEALASADPQRLTNTALAQPALVALSVAVGRLWRHWGLAPLALLGHSVGELAAACLADALPLDAVLRFALERGALMASLPPGGAMLAVFASATRVSDLLAQHATTAPSVTIAALNATDETVLSGWRSDLEPLVHIFDQHGLTSQWLAVSHAFHSSLLEPIQPRLRAAAELLVAHVQAPQCTLVSGVTGQPLLAAELAQADYWVRQARQPVQFATGLQTLRATGCTQFVEVGPGAALVSLGRRTLDDQPGLGRRAFDDQPGFGWWPSLRRGVHEERHLLAALGGLWTAGVPLDLAAHLPTQLPHAIDLPTYPFQRQRFWTDPPSQTMTSTAKTTTSTTAADPAGKAMTSTAADQPLLGRRATEIDNCFYEIAWQPRARSTRAKGFVADDLATPEALAELLNDDLPRLEAEHGLPMYAQLLPELDALSSRYVADALKQLGWSPRHGEYVSVDRLAQNLGVVDKHRRIARRMLEMLAEDGLLVAGIGPDPEGARGVGPAADQGWTVVGELSGTDPRPGWLALLERFPAGDAELQLFGRCASALADVLTGRQDPLQLLFPPGLASQAGAERLYQAPFAQVLNGLIATTVAGAIGAATPGRLIRILEVGAGTGATTTHILSALPSDSVEYVFTDVSSVFTTRAAERWRDQPSITYRLLDIERDPLSQGFAEGTFDIVLAANVLHATRDLRESLANIHRLLAPGGLLVLGEGTGPQRWIDLTFGLTDGWWRFDDDVRADHPLLNQPRWVDLLTESGFVGAAAVPPAEAGSAHAQQAVIVASKPCPRSADTAIAGSTDGWLVIGDATGVGEALVACLTAAGRPCHLVDPADGSGLERWVGGRSGQRWRGVVYLRGLDCPEADALTTPALAAAQEYACGGALQLVKDLAQADRSVLPRLWLVTRGAQPVGFDDEAVNPVQAPLWGLGRVVALEHPELFGGLIDLDARCAADHAARVILGEIDAPDGEREVAFRADRRLVARLRRCRDMPPPQRRRQLSAQATYLITGGMGGLGLELAGWLVERGARHLALLGRSPPSATARSAIEDLERAGAQVLVLRADVSDEVELGRAFEEIRRALPPVRGIVHAAGTFDDRTLLNHDWQRFAAVMAPKVQGAWNIHAATLDLDLDFLVYFSSAATLLGEIGLANYVAANAFLDALAHYRRARGLPAVSVDWGPWDQLGMSQMVGRQREQQWLAQGLTPLSPALALEAFERVLDANQAQVGVLRVDWNVHLAQYSPAGLPSLLTELVAASGGEARIDRGPPAGGRPIELLEQLRQLPTAMQRELLATHVREQAGRVLGLDQARPLHPHQPLNELGLDSLMAVELRNSLASSLGQTLPVTLLFDYPTPEALTRYLATDVLRLIEAEPTPATTHVDARNEPIAIVGMACRFPGGANDPDRFWQLLLDGADLITEIPPERWDVDRYYDPDPDAPGKMATRHAGLVDDFDQFDAAFFGITPREAASMDPQQRMLLELSWEALERAGQAPDRLAASRTGVFVGVYNTDYAQLVDDPTAIDAYTSIGNAASVAAGRLSYLLGLQGPSLAVDTACSSSLVAIHLACQSLRAGESDLAVAGGANLIASPNAMIALSRLRMLAADGRCKTFDARADGFVRGEGCGVVILKRLSDAVRARDPVLAVVRGSAVNQDGRSGGLTAPNGPAQADVIRAALAQAGVAPAEVGYIEAHGTGTALGDPIEVRTLGLVLGEGRQPEQRFLLGSVKTNAGHLEGAAGVAGVIKGVLALQHATVPPHLHFESPNPYIDWAELPVIVPAAPTAWPPAYARRIAGVSSFGFSGTNAHVVLEQGPEDVPSEGGPAQPAHLLVLSARSERSLRELARRYAGHLVAHPELALADVCWTAAVGRAELEHRLAVIAVSTEQAIERLVAFAEDRRVPGVEVGLAQPGATSTSAEGEFPILPTLDMSDDQWLGALVQLAEGWAVGRSVDWDSLYAPLACRKVVLPTYAFERRRYWHDRIRPGRPQGAARNVATDRGHPLLGRRVPSPLAAVQYEARLSPRAPAFLDDHRIHDVAVLPATALLEMALAAAVERFSSSRPTLGQVSIHAPLVLPEEGERTVQVILSPADDGGASFEILSLANHDGRDAEWILHAAGSAQARDPGAATPTMLAADAVKARCATELTHDAFYRSTSLAGFQFGPTFQGLQRVWRRTGEAIAEIDLPDALSGNSGAFQLHPALLDACLQTFAATLIGEADADPTPYVPIGVERYALLGAAGGRLWSHAVGRAGQAGSDTLAVDVRIYHDDLTPLASVEGLYLKRATRDHLLRGAQRQIDQLLYLLDWQAQSAPGTDAAQLASGGRWLILSDSGGFGAATADRLTALGHTCDLVYRTPGHGATSVDPYDRRQFDTLLAEIFRAGEQRLNGILFLWGLDHGSDSTHDDVPAEDLRDDACVGLLHLAQAVAGHSSSAPPRLWVVTQGSQAIGASSVNARQAPLWGLTRVVTQEQPALRCTAIDLDPARIDSAGPLVAELLSTGSEDQVAFRTATRYVARLVEASRLTPHDSEAFALHGDSTYLITGGFGALGLLLADWMVERGARHLLLIGRRPPSEAARSRLAQLERAGAAVRVATVDVTRLDQLANALTDATASMPPLRGVVHAAGIVDDGVLLNLTWQRLVAVMAPKVTGAWNIDYLTRGAQLDFFILFSSIATLLGPPGQASYAAANAYLDALAHQRRRRGQSALTINWGPWRDVGMAAGVGSSDRRRWAGQGIGELDTTAGLAALDRALLQDLAQIAVVPVDWDRFLRSFPAEGAPPLFTQQASRVRRARVPSGDPELAQRLQLAHAGDQRRIVLDYVREQAATVLSLDSPDLLEIRRPLNEQGFDSLMAVDLTRALGAGMGEVLPATLLFEQPTLEGVAEYLLARLSGELSTLNTTPSDNAALAAALDEIEHLSESELDAMLAQAANAPQGEA